MPDQDKVWDRTQTLYAVSHLARSQPIHRIVPLDDFDLEIAAAVREHLRIPGMGETITHYFRDKLAMRMQAREHGVAVPEFVHLLNDEKVARFLQRAASLGPEAALYGWSDRDQEAARTGRSSAS